MKLFKHKYLRFIIILTIVGVILFSFYIYTYQKLITEGSDLADEHCIRINPLIIARKNSYLEEMRLIKASASAELVKNSLDNYFAASNNYINEESLWLKKQRWFLDSLSFSLLMPTEIREAAEAQYQMYEADYKSSLYTNQAFTANEQSQQIDLMNKVMEETRKRDEAEQKYDAVWKNNQGNRSWQFMFVKIPPSQCPAENFDIPDTENPLAPKVPSDTDTNTSG